MLSGPGNYSTTPLTTHSKSARSSHDNQQQYQLWLQNAHAANMSMHEPPLRRMRQVASSSSDTQVHTVHNFSGIT
jgi:hypothetical protein